MIKTMLIFVVTMFMSFVQSTVTRDCEVALCDERQLVEEHMNCDEMDDPFLRKEIEIDEETYFELSGYECSCGEVFFSFAYDSDECYFIMFADESGRVLYYEMEYYE